LVYRAGPVPAQQPDQGFIGTKLVLITLTAALAVHAKLRLIPQLSDNNLNGLARQLCGNTAQAIA